MQAHLKAPQANATPKLLKELAKPTQKKRNFKNAPPHDRKTMKEKPTNRPPNYDRQGSTGGNSGFKKLAVQWLQEIQFSNETFVVTDSLRLRNRQLLKPAKR